MSTMTARQTIYKSQPSFKSNRKDANRCEQAFCSSCYCNILCGRLPSPPWRCSSRTHRPTIASKTLLLIPGWRERDGTVDVFISTRDQRKQHARRGPFFFCCANKPTQGAEYFAAFDVLFCVLSRSTPTDWLAATPMAGCCAQLRTSSLHHYILLMGRWDDVEIINI